MQYMLVCVSAAVFGINLLSLIVSLSMTLLLRMQARLVERFFTTEGLANSRDKGSNGKYTVKCGFLETGQCTKLKG